MGVAPGMAATLGFVVPATALRVVGKRLSLDALGGQDSEQLR